MQILYTASYQSGPNQEDSRKLNALFFDNLGNNNFLPPQSVCKYWKRKLCMLWGWPGKSWMKEY